MKHPIMMKQMLSVTLLSGLLLAAVSCKKKESSTLPVTVEANNNTNITLTKIGEVNLSGASTKALVYATREPEIGYNELYIALNDSASGVAISTGPLSIHPIMDMGSMQHGAPTENNGDSLANNGYYKIPVVFTMSGTASQWSIDVIFQNSKNGRLGKGNLPLAVKSSPAPKFRSTVIMPENNSSLYICLQYPLKAQVGINELELVLFKKIDAWHYDPVTDYTLEIEPVMPSMGHGSPNNVNPVHTSKGHYKGKVNFTMSGLWQIKLKFFKNGVLLSDDQYFEITI